MKGLFFALLAATAAAPAHAFDQVPDALYQQILTDHYPLEDRESYYTDLPHTGLGIELFKFESKDLNGDGTPDFLIPGSPGHCGSGGCQEWGYVRHGDKYELIFDRWQPATALGR